PAYDTVRNRCRNCPTSPRQRHHYLSPPQFDKRSDGVRGDAHPIASSYRHLLLAGTFMMLSPGESRLVTSPVIFYVPSPKNGVHHLMWMRRTIGIVLLALGGVWIAQGSGALHGSFMTGEALWTVIGVIVGL